MTQVQLEPQRCVSQYCPLAHWLLLRQLAIAGADAVQPVVPAVPAPALAAPPLLELPCPPTPAPLAPPGVPTAVPDVPTMTLVPALPPAPFPPGLSVAPPQAAAVTDKTQHIPRCRRNREQAGGNTGQNTTGHMSRNHATARGTAGSKAALARIGVDEVGKRAQGVSRERARGFEFSPELRWAPCCRNERQSVKDAMSGARCPVRVPFRGLYQPQRNDVVIAPW